MALVGNDAIGEISACFQHRQAGLYGGSVHFHVCGGKQCADRGGRIGWLQAIDPDQHPHKFAKARQRDRDQFGIRPGEKIELDLLPDGRGMLKAARFAGTIDGFVGLLSGRTKKVATIDEINEAIAQGWAGKE